LVQDLLAFELELTLGSELLLLLVLAQELLAGIGAAGLGAGDVGLSSTGASGFGAGPAGV
jgi:hypothetical protein